MTNIISMLNTMPVTEWSQLILSSGDDIDTCQNKLWMIVQLLQEY